MRNPQHDDHCWFMLYGEHWKIYRYEAGLAHLWRVSHPDLRNWFAIVDFGPMDIEEYVEEAVRLMHQHEMSV